MLDPRTRPIRRPRHPDFWPPLAFVPLTASACDLNFSPSTVSAMGRAWSAAIEQMDAQRAAGRLDLPLSNHRYLFAMLAGMADKREAAVERQQEEERRTGPRPDAAPQVRGQPQTPLQALQQSQAPRAPGSSPLVRRIREELARKRGEGDEGGNS